MSNDAKFWMWRVALSALTFINLSLLSKLVIEGMSPHGHAGGWAFGFFVVMAATIAVAVKYMYAKRARWETPHDTQSDLETLNNYVKQQKQLQEQEKTPGKMPK